MMGEPLSSQANVNMAMQTLLTLNPNIIVHNVRAQRLWVCALPPWAPEQDHRVRVDRPLDETDHTQICSLLALEYRIKHATPEQVKRAITAFECLLDEYDPVRNYLFDCRRDYEGSESDARELLYLWLPRGPVGQWNFDSLIGSSRS